MKMTKLSLVMVAVVAIGIFALPTTLSIGTGQHQFRQAGTVETSLTDFCNQCHATGADSISNELSTSDTRANGNLGYAAAGTRVHFSQGCNNCHAIAGGYGVQQVTSEHAAQLPSCLKCHGPGLENVGNDVTIELNAAQEAHRQVFADTQATDDDIMCIGCHTYTPKTGAVTYSFSAGVDVYGLHIGE